MSLPRSSKAALASVLLILVAAAGAAGYAIGNHGSHASVRVGMGIAYLTRTEGTAYLGASLSPRRAPEGFAYALAPSVTWIDAEGTLHEGSGPPSCLPYGSTRRVEMETVLYHVADAVTGSVLWIRC